MVRPFTKEEIEKENDGFPSRGIFCPKCGVNIPVFEGLDEAEESAIRKAGKGNPVETIRIIRERAGCGVRWGKIWAIHPNGPQPKGFTGDGKCPYCGARLRTPHAKQCPECFKSWRNEENII